MERSRDAVPRPAIVWSVGAIVAAFGSGSCGADDGTASGRCGDGVCETVESCSACPQDWKGDAAVAVDPSAVLTVGDTYEIVDAQDYFGTPIVSGTFDGSPVDLPLTGTATAQPIGSPAKPYIHTSTEFSVFVLRIPTT